MTNSPHISNRPSVLSERRSPLLALAMGVVRLYQSWHAGRPSPCRFTPSCSNYALEALEVHGFWRGSVLAARRVLRCNPFGPYGADLVPPARKVR